jgi:hypothetical protein
MDEMVGILASILIVLIEWLNVTGLFFYAGRISESYWVILGLLCVVYRITSSRVPSVNDEASARGSVEYGKQ